MRRIVLLLIVASCGHAPEPLCDCRSVEVDPPSASVGIGETQAFRAFTKGADGTVVDASATWASDDGRIATVDASGHATGHAPGTVNINATVDGVKGSATLTVLPPTPFALHVTPTSATVDVGGTVSLTAYADFDDGTTTNVTEGADWASADPAVATVSSGTVAGVSRGTTTVTASLGDVTSNAAAITVASHDPVAIQVTPSSVSIGPEPQQLEATLIFADGINEDITVEAEWTSSDPSVATISSTGLATGVASGTTLINAVYAGITSNDAVVTVIIDTVVDVVVSPSTLSVGAGCNSGQLTATALWPDATTEDVTDNAGWTSSEPTIATVDKGTVTGVTVGQAEVTATFAGLTSAPTLVTVVACPP